MNSNNSVEFYSCGIVEPVRGVDAEGIEVAKECLVEAFKLDYVSFAREPDSLIDLFKSLEANKQCESSRSDVCPPPDSVEASSSLSDQNAAHAKNHSEASKTKVNFPLPVVFCPIRPFYSCHISTVYLFLLPLEHQLFVCLLFFCEALFNDG